MISNVLQEIMLDYFNRYLQVKVTFHVVDNRTVCEREINVEIISYFTKPLFWLRWFVIEMQNWVVFLSDKPE